MCKETKECDWFTFDEHEKDCQLFVSCSDLIGCDDCISGNSKCEISNLKHSVVYIIVKKKLWKGFVNLVKMASVRLL